MKMKECYNSKELDKKYKLLKVDMKWMHIPFCDSDAQFNAWK